MTFNDVFKSSFLESVTAFSPVDTLIGMLVSVVLGLFIFVMPSIPENAGQMKAVGRPDRGDMAFPGQGSGTDTSATIRENLITYQSEPFVVVLREEISSEFRFLQLHIRF